MVTKEEVQIVLERLKTMPPGLKLSIGNKGTYTKWQMMEEVEKKSDLGKLIVDVYMSNLRAFKN